MRAALAAAFVSGRAVPRGSPDLGAVGLSAGGDREDSGW